MRASPVVTPRASPVVTPRAISPVEVEVRVIYDI